MQGTLRMLLVARAQLISGRQAVAQHHTGLQKTFGYVVARGSCGSFAVCVRTLAGGNPTLEVIVEPLLTALQTLREQTAVLDRMVLLRAKADRTARRRVPPNRAG